MNNKNLEKWAQLLLDTGKRNNLINFRDSKLSTVEVVCPDFNTFFEKISNGNTFEVFDPKKDDFDEYYFEEDDNDTKDEYVSKEDYIKRYQSKLKKSSALLYNFSNKPLASLKNIMKRGRLAIEETGVNVIYFAFGFMHWYEEEDTKTFYKAPIILIPAKIKNDSWSEPFFLSELDDEIIVNPTLHFKLKNEFGIELPEYSDLGIDEYLESISQLIQRLGWKITKEIKISSFSFLKINMYNDVISNEDIIAKNKNVLVLLGEENASLEKDIENPKIEEKGIIELHNVVDADSSQIQAIELAKSGKSFVLQGPPGTGKSQTITNIISECLYDGKKVLFVSEKLAALNVVFNKLKQNGLSDFCLELHSHKTNKKDVIDELNRTLHLDKSHVSRKADDVIKQKMQYVNKLNEYANELHKVRDIINMSFYEIFNNIAKYKEVEKIDYYLDDIESKDHKYLERSIELLDKYTAFVETIGKDYHKNVWFGLFNFDNSPMTKAIFERELRNVSVELKRLYNTLEFLDKEYGLKCNKFDDVFDFNGLIKYISSSKFMTPSLLMPKNYKMVMELLPTIKENVHMISSMKSYIDSEYTANVYKYEYQNRYNELKFTYNNILKRLFSKNYKLLLAELQPFNKLHKMNYRRAISLMHWLDEYNKNSESFKQNNEIIEPLMSDKYKGLKTDFDKLEKELSAFANYKKYNLGNLSSLTNECFKETKEVLANKETEIGKCYENIQNSFNFKTYFDAKVVSFDNLELEDLMAKVNNYIDNFDYIDNWCNFYKLYNQLKKDKLIDFVNYCIDNDFSENRITNLFNQIFYTCWAYNLMNNIPVLAELDRLEHDKIINEFITKDNYHFDINKSKIKEKLSSERPNLNLIANGSSVQIIMREAEKKRKIKPIRNLFMETKELVQKLKPCFLMSPLSVSTYLSPDFSFDVVIFDEASQIFPQDALVAIYRGKQIIVVGDSKQMPPSNFFTSSIDVDDEEDDENVSNFESILDKCSASFNQLRLKWHYRSRYEQLISFSNKNYYNNDLVTFPSSSVDKKWIGVDYLFVDGVFDHKTKTNDIEAKKVVDLIYENFAKYPERSLGVVAFSISQQNHIERLLAKKRKAEPIYEELFAQDRKEPFFIKNLETVQGDERDTIIFSVGYGKDNQGRIIHNFGPIIKMGGERRLNVAVTRAKDNVQVVSSMHHTDIDLSRTQSKGTRLLKEYLSYAENGILPLDKPLNDNEFEQNEADFEKEIGEFLVQNGYEVDMKIGCSSFKIDLGVKRPNSSDYALAIECDGLSYKSALNARDRDRLRKQVLENMGWKYYRIWSADWFKNNKVEKDRLLEAVKNAINQTPKSNNPSSKTETGFEETVSITDFKFPVYIYCDLETPEWKRKFNLNFTDALIEVLKNESPLSEEWLLKRIAYLFGREKVTSVVRDEFSALKHRAKSKGVIFNDGFIYYKDNSEVLFRISDPINLRKLEYIADEELAQGILEILKLNIKATKNDIYSLLLKQIGITRLTDQAYEALDKALIVIQDQIITDGEYLIYKEQ